MVLMWMNLKDKAKLIINNDMRYFLFDENYDEHAWDDMMNALAGSESYQVENSTNYELIEYLKIHINEMNKNDLQPLSDALKVNDDLFDERMILESIEDGDD